MATELRAISFTLTRAGVLMIGLGTAICALGSLMAKPAYELAGYVVASFLTALCLVIGPVSVGIRDKTVPRPLLAVYLAAGALPIVCCLIFWLIQSASADLRLLGILAGLVGLFWGTWYMKLAFRFKANSIKQVTLAALAATTSSFGIILATHTGLTRFISVTMAGCYFVLLGIQLYLTSAFLYREYAKAQVFSRK